MERVDVNVNVGNAKDGPMRRMRYLISHLFILIHNTGANRCKWALAGTHDNSAHSLSNR
jgi:hypothetical protein